MEELLARIASLEKENEKIREEIPTSGARHGERNDYKGAIL